jgi:hypothetical protein
MLQGRSPSGPGAGRCLLPGTGGRCPGLGGQAHSGPSHGALKGQKLVAGGNAPGTVTAGRPDPEGVAQALEVGPRRRREGLYSTLTGSGWEDMLNSGGVAPGYFINPLWGFPAAPRRRTHVVGHARDLKRTRMGSERKRCSPVTAMANPGKRRTQRAGPDVRKRIDKGLPTLVLWAFRAPHTHRTESFSPSQPMRRNPMLSREFEKNVKIVGTNSTSPLASTKASKDEPKTNSKRTQNEAENRAIKTRNGPNKAMDRQWPSALYDSRLAAKKRANPRPPAASLGCGRSWPR